MNAIAVRPVASGVLTGSEDPRRAPAIDRSIGRSITTSLVLEIKEVELVRTVLLHLGGEGGLGVVLRRDRLLRRRGGQGFSGHLGLGWGRHGLGAEDQHLVVSRYQSL